MPGPFVAGAVAGVCMDGVDALAAFHLREKFINRKQRRVVAACTRKLAAQGVIYGPLPSGELSTKEQFIGLGVFLLDKLKVPVRTS